jgi:8-oxo-dGTP diphosphatase
MSNAFGRKGKRPTVGCDCVVFGKRGGILHVLLVKRGKDPFIGKWALPGGFMEWNESCEQAAARELEEETGLKGLKLEPVGVFSKPGRDPRGTIISVAFRCEAGSARMRVKGGDDAEEAAWIPLKKIPRLAFDHDEILKSALRQRKKVR